MKRLLKLKSYKKSVELYSRALWGMGFDINAVIVGDAEVTPASYIMNNQIHVPDEVVVGNTHDNYYRAAVTHAALHVMSDAEIFERENLNLMQRTIVGLVEDLRLELEAIKRFPGLRKLWLGFHDAIDTNHISAFSLIQRLSRCVLDPDAEDSHQWVIKGKKKIITMSRDYISPADVLDVGMSLANDLGQMRLPLNSGKYEQPIVYRDDNRCLWKEVLEHRNPAEEASGQMQSHASNSRFIENDSDISLRLFESKRNPDGSGFEIRQDNGDDLEYLQSNSLEIKAPSLYPEWDYRTQILKQNWCQVRETTCGTGSMEVVDQINYRHKYILKRMQRMANRLRVEKQQWQRKVEDGEDYDLMYMVDAMVSVRANRQPDTRVYIRKAQLRENNLAISILLDLSESTNEIVEGGEESVSQIMRDAVYLLAETLSIVGDRFSIAGFSSDTRHHVNYIRFKSFEENHQSTKDRLSTIKGEYSTRLGTAIRHSASELSKLPERKKLLLVITDGAPSDIDVFDEHYLIQDSWYAVRGLGQYGIRPFCINLDRKADKIIEHVFGRGKSETLEHVTHLPDLLAHLYMRYMHAG